MPTKPEQLEKIRNKVTTWRSEAEGGNRSAFRRMTKCQRFKIGHQWSKEDLEYNQAHHKHSATINQVLPIVNFLDGEQVRNPRDLTAVAYKGGNNTRARLLTALMKQVCDSSHGRHQQSEAFDSGVTTGRGYLGIDTTYLSDPFGDLQLCTFNPFSVLPDPQRKTYNPNDWHDGWRYVFIDEWEPRFKINTQYPDKKEDLGHAHYGGGAEANGFFGRLLNFLFPGNEPWDNHDDYRDPNQAEDPEPDTKTKWEDHYRVSTCYWRDWRKGVYVQRLDVPNWFVVLYKEDEIRRAKALARQAEQEGIPSPVKVIEKGNDGLSLVVPVLMRTKMIGDVLLDHTEDPFDGIWKYPIAPYSAYFEDGIEFGIVDNLIGPQEVCNWAWSMCLNIIKKVANTGWRIRSATAAWRQWLENYGSEDGVIIEEEKFGGKAEKLEPTQYPAAFHNVTANASVQMREIANVRTERPEFDAKNQSGVAIARKQASSDQGSAPVFGNFDMSLEIIGDVLVDHIVRRDTYTQDEIMELVDKEDLVDDELLEKAREAVVVGAGITPIPPQMPPAELLARLDPEAAALMIADYQEHLTAWKLAMLEAEKVAPDMAVKMLLDELKEIQQGKTKFGVKSSLSESASTFREAKFAETWALDQALRQRGDPGLPREELINASDVPHKERILQQKPQQEQLPAPALAAA